MFARGSKWLVVAALVFATGLQWAALQTVAWTAMLAGNLRGNSVALALNKTFDGRHPCCLCKAIAAGKRSEKKSESVSPAAKMEFPLQAEAAQLFPPSRFGESLPQDFFARSLAQPPPVPPPRPAVV